MALVGSHAIPPSPAPNLHLGPVPLDKELEHIDWSSMAQGLSPMVHRILKLTVPPAPLGMKERHFLNGRRKLGRKKIPHHNELRVFRGK